VFDEVASLAPNILRERGFSMGGSDLPFVGVACDCVVSSVGVEESVVLVLEVFSKTVRFRFWGSLEAGSCGLESSDRTTLGKRLFVLGTNCDSTSTSLTPGTANRSIGCYCFGAGADARAPARGVLSVTAFWEVLINVSGLGGELEAAVFCGIVEASGRIWRVVFLGGRLSASKRSAIGYGLL
jgi:hypothetical protein